MPSHGLRGVYVPLVSPFEAQGAFDTDAYRRLIDFVLAAGVHGLLTSGTTGEFPLLSGDERRVAAETAVEHVAGRVPVVVHVGAATTREAVGLARHARDIGATAVAAAAPYFYALGNAALCDYFRHISASVADLPFYLYNIPQRTGNAITPALAREVASSCDNVVGIKDSSGDLTRTLEMRGIRPGGFQVAMGSDALLLPALSMGVEAAVAGNANVFPEVAVDVFESWWRGDVAAAQRAQDRFSAIRRALKEGSDLSLLKSALAHRGVPVGTVRPPLRAAPEAEVQLALSALFE